MSKGAWRLFCVFVVAVSLFLQQAEAAEGEAVDSLDVIVVSATKTEKSLADVPASVTVVTKEDLKKKNYQNLNEALETIAGVFSYEGRGIATTSPVVNLRGFHGHMRTLVMVNGQPISPNLYGMALVHWSAIPVDDVERIEVVRGPFSALYGGDAVGGVVNIITKCPEKFEATIRTGYGSDDTYRIHLSTGLKLRDNLNLFLGFDKKKTDGYVSDYYILQPTTADPAATPVTGAVKQPYKTGGAAYVVGDLGRLEFDEQTFTFGLNWKPTTSSYLTLKSLISAYDITPVGSASYLRDGSGNEVRSGTVTFMDNGSPVYLSLSSGKFLNSQNGEKTTGVYTAEYGTKLSHDLDLKATIGLTDFHKEKFMIPGSTATETGGSGTLIDAPSTILQTELQANYRGVKGMVLTTGLSYRRDEGEYTLSSATNWRDFSSASTLIQRIEPSSNRYGLYIQAEINPVDKVVLYLGGRYDRWDSEATTETSSATAEMESDGADSFSPKAALVYTPFDNTIVRLSGGKAFRVPNFFELYQPLYTYGATYLPNPGLKPETTWAWELGLEQRFFDGATVLEATYFQHYTSDFIDSRTYVSGGTTYNQRDNFGKVEVKGIELTLNQRITDSLKGFLNYTYNDAEITENEVYPAYVGKRPRYVPKSMFNGGLDFRKGLFSASAVTHYISKIYNDNLNSTVNWNVYGVQDRVNFVTDLSAGLDFLNHFNFTVTVNNLFDSEYYQYNKAPGRTVFGILTMKFN